MKHLVIVIIVSLLASCTSKNEDTFQNISELKNQVNVVYDRFTQISPANYREIAEYNEFKQIDSIISALLIINDNSLYKKEVSQLISYCDSSVNTVPTDNLFLTTSDFLCNKSTKEELLKFEIMLGYMLIGNYYNYTFSFHLANAISVNDMNTYKIGDTISTKIYLAVLHDYNGFIAIIGDDTLENNNNMIPNYKFIAKEKGTFIKDGVLKVYAPSVQRYKDFEFKIEYEVK